MSKLDRDIVQKTAFLARLELSEEETTRLQDELEDIFTLLDSIDREDIRNLKPLAHPLGDTQRLRADEPVERDMIPYIERNAPLAENDYILVPKVLK